MRIIQSFLYEQALGHVQRNLTDLTRVQEQILSGRRFSRPEQDPVGFERSLGLRSEQRRTTQYLDNVESARSTLDFALAAIQTSSESLGRVRPAILSVANGTASIEQRRALAEDLRQLRQQLLAQANTRLQGQAVFGGTFSGRTPFAEDASGKVSYLGDGLQRKATVAPGVTMPLIFPGDSIFLSRAPHETLFEGTTGAAPGAGFDTATGVGFLDLVHTATFYGDEGLGAGGDTVSGLAPGTSSAASDTILGGPGVHEIALTVAADGLSGTVSLDGGQTVSFTSSDTDLRVEGIDGEILYLDLSSVTAGFSGTVSLRAEGQITVDGGSPPVALDYTATQVFQDSTTQKKTHVDTSAVRKAGRETVTYAGTTDLFSSIDGLIQDLEAESTISLADLGGVTRGRLREIDHGADTLRDTLAVVGSRSARLDSVRDHLSDAETQIASLLGRFEGVDLTEAAGRLAQLELGYEATLTVSARLLSLNNLLSII